MATKNFYVNDGLKVKGNTLLNGSTYTDSPSSKLHVKTAANGAGSNLSNVNGLIIENSGSSTNYAFKIATGCGNIFSIENRGFVGIGTTQPNEKLTVVGDISASGSLYGSIPELEVTDLTITGDLSVAGDSRFAGVTASTICNTGDITVTGDVEADEFIGDLRGAVEFKAQAGEAISKGDVVYISGISGNTTVVSKADADDNSKMPAFGIASASVGINNPVSVYTFGTLSNIDTSLYPEGTELFVSTSAGGLLSAAPTGESAQIQKIAKVTRQHASSGSIKIMGAGRSNATPNLNEGRLFVGNSSNQAVADGTIHVDIANSRVGINDTSPFFDLDVAGCIRATECMYLGCNLIHDGDTNTSFGFCAADAARIVTCGCERQAWRTDYTVINEGGHSYDFRVEGDTDPNLLFVDGSDDKVGIGITGHLQKFAVAGAALFTSDSNLGSDSQTGSVLLSGADAGIYSTTAASSHTAARLLIKHNSSSEIEIGHTSIYQCGTLFKGGSGADTKFRFVNDGDNERMRITHGGDVGIGTDNPGARLEIQDTDNHYITIGDAAASSLTAEGVQDFVEAHSAVSFSRTVDGNKYLTGMYSYGATSNDTTPNVVLAARGDTILAAGGTSTLFNSKEVLRATSSGNVGIGTPNPTQLLHLSGGSIKVNSENTNTALFLESSDPRVAIDLVDGTTTASGYVNIGALGDQLYFRTGNSERVRIDAAGNVGIGTTNPNSKLQVAGRGYFGPVGTGDATTKVLMDTYSVLKLKPHDTNSTNMTFAQVNGGNGIGIQVTNGGQTADWDIALNPFGGNVGIGVTTPENALHVVSTDNAQLLVQNTSTGDAAIKINRSGKTFFMGIESSDNSFRISDSSTGVGSNDRLVINSSGNVGIGTTDPDEKLHVTARSSLNGIRIGENSNQIQFPCNAIIAFGNTSYLNIIKGSTSALYIDSSANVGIGTTCPSTNFSVKEHLLFNDTTRLLTICNNTNNGGINIVGGNSRLYFNGYRALEGDTTGTTLAIGESYARVGIRTSNPTAQLHVDINGRALGVFRASHYPSTLSTTFFDSTFAANCDGGGAHGFFYTSHNCGTFPFDKFGETILQGNPRSGNYNRGISFVTGNGTAESIKMRINESGNVGIGTTDPQYKLDVNGSIRGNKVYITTRDTNTSSNDVAVFNGTEIEQREINSLVWDSCASFLSGSGTQNYLSKWEAGGNSLTDSNILDDGTSIGIGTSSADTWSVGNHTYLTSQAGANKLAIFNLVAQGTNGSYIQLGNTSIRRASIHAVDGSHLQFSVNNSNCGTALTPAMRIKNNGNVGIGTTDPSAKLHIKEGLVDIKTNTYGLTLEECGTGGWARAYDLRTGTPSANETAFFGAFGNHTTGVTRSYWVIGDRTEPTGYNCNNGIHLEAGGNVGIGTTNPAYKLDVTGTARFTGFTRLQGGGTVVADAEGEFMLKRSSGATAGDDVTSIWQSDAGINFLIDNDDDADTGTFNVMYKTGGSNATLFCAVPDTFTVPSTLVANQLCTSQYLRHTGDDNTYFEFHGEDCARVVTGGAERIDIGNAGICINDGGQDYDFRVESANDTTALFVNGGNDNVRIGANSTNTETVKLAVGYIDDAITVNGSNFYKSVAANIIGGHNIAAGVVDDGYRIAVDASAYVNDTDFLGTLDEQIGLWARHGAYISGTGSTICNSYGVLIDTLTNSCTTICNLWGLYQEDATASNYFSGGVGIGTTQPAEKLDVRGDIAIQSGCFIGSGNTYGTSTAANYADFQIYDATTGFTNLNNQGFGIHLCTASTPRLTITNGGAVGIGTTAGTGTGCLFVGTPLTPGSSAIAQINGLVRTDYIIAHNTVVSIHPDTTCTGALGTGSKVFGCAHIREIVSYGHHRPDTDDNHTLGTATCRWANVYATCTTTGAVIESNLCTQGIDSCPKGSVVVWRDGGLKGTTQEYDYNVMGVTAPGSDAPIVMGAEPILVTGDIKEGDPIVTSSKVNHGMKGDRSCDLHGKVIAQALENGSGESYIIQGMIRKF